MNGYIVTDELVALPVETEPSFFMKLDYSIFTYNRKNLRTITLKGTTYVVATTTRAGLGSVVLPPRTPEVVFEITSMYISSCSKIENGFSCLNSKG